MRVRSSASSYRAKPSSVMHAAHDAGLLEHGEVPVDGALRHPVATAHEIRRRQTGVRRGGAPRRARVASACTAGRPRAAARSTVAWRSGVTAAPASVPARSERARPRRSTVTTANTPAAITSTIVPPGASPQIRESARPATTEPTPIATPTTSSPRNERASICPLATGSTIIAATSRMPTICIAATTDTAVETASTVFSDPDRQAGDPRPVLVGHDREQRAAQHEHRRRRSPTPSSTMTAISSSFTVSGCPNR